MCSKVLDGLNEIWPCETAKPQAFHKARACDNAQLPFLLIISFLKGALWAKGCSGLLDFEGTTRNGTKVFHSVSGTTGHVPHHTHNWWLTVAFVRVRRLGPGGQRRHWSTNHSWIKHRLIRLFLFLGARVASRGASGGIVKLLGLCLWVCIANLWLFYADVIHILIWIPDLRAFQPALGRIFHVESEFAVKNVRF